MVFDEQIQGLKGIQTPPFLPVEAIRAAVRRRYDEAITLGRISAHLSRCLYCGSVECEVKGVGFFRIEVNGRPDSIILHRAIYSRQLCRPVGLIRLAERH